MGEGTKRVRTAGGTGTRIASLEGLLVAALAEIIGAGMGNYSALLNLSIGPFRDEYLVFCGCMLLTPITL